MRSRRTIAWGNLVGWVILSCVMVAGVIQVVGMDRRLAEFIDQTQRDRRMQTLETTWTTNGTPPQTITVTTVRKEGETVDAWVQRHNDAVTAAGG